MLSDTHQRSEQPDCSVSKQSHLEPSSACETFNESDLERFS